jgi:hypothetical protein
MIYKATIYLTDKLLCIGNFKNTVVRIQLTLIGYAGCTRMGEVGSAI